MLLKGDLNVREGDYYFWVKESYYSVLTALPTYVMYYFVLPRWIREKIGRIRSRFLGERVGEQEKISSYKLGPSMQIKGNERVWDARLKVL